MLDGCVDWVFDQMLSYRLGYEKLVLEKSLIISDHRLCFAELFIPMILGMDVDSKFGVLTQY